MFRTECVHAQKNTCGRNDSDNATLNERLRDADEGIMYFVKGGKNTYKKRASGVISSNIVSKSWTSSLQRLIENKSEESRTVL